MAEFCTCDVKQCELHRPHNIEFLRAEAKIIDEFEIINALHPDATIGSRLNELLHTWRRGWRECRQAQRREVRRER